MSILAIARFFAALLSLAILGAAAYLIWSWQSGELVRDAAGALHRERDSWRLWTGAGLLAWSFLGRTVVLALMARPDRRKTRAVRGDGGLVPGATGSTLYVETHGRGSPPIIMTHGWGMDSTFWTYAREDLADRFRVVLWDLPGLGQSRPRDAEAITLEAFAADLAHLVDLSGPDKPVLVGHSIGGMIIQTLMRDRPELQDRLRGLVLLNTTFTNPLRTMVFAGLLRALQRPLLEPAAKLAIMLQPVIWLSKWQSYLSGSSHLAHRLGFGKFVTRSQLEHATLLSTRSPPAVQARGDLAMFRWDAREALRHVRIPVLVIGGEKDIVTKCQASKAIQGETDMAALRVIADVNHMGPMERADLYNQLIADFALEVRPGYSTDNAARPAALPQAAEPGPSGRERGVNLH